MNDKHENEGDESLDENTLAGRELRSDAGDAECADKLVGSRCLQAEDEFEFSELNHVLRINLSCKDAIVGAQKR
jgi:hypothetical protein